jgi:outer membrane receptor protein involved in Fe transport
MIGALLALVALATGSAAQGTGVVQGRVRAAENGAPLSDVTVRMEGTRWGAITDAAGAYRIAGVTAGTYVLVAQRIGVETRRDTITVAADASVTVDFRLASAAHVLAPTVVSASREAQRRAEASATINVLDGAEIRRTRAAHPNEIMNRLAGVHVIELSGEGHMTAIRQPITTKPVYLYLEDGIPTRATGFFNHNALYEVNIPQAGGIEVLKGPGTALYGSDAIGGVVNVLTRPAPATPSLEATAEGGAYGWGRLLMTGGNSWGNNGVRADLNLTRTDGWRQSSGYHREIGTVRWDHASAGGWNAKTVVTGSNIHQNDVFTLNQSQFDSRSDINLSPITYRKVQALRLSTAIEKQSGPSLLSLTPYARYDLLDLMPYWQLSFDPQLWHTQNTSLGLLAKWRRDLTPINGRVIAGFDADWSPGAFTATQVIATKTGTASNIYSAYRLGEMQYDYDVTYHALSPYAQLELTPLSRLRLDAGLRYDMAGYSYENHLTVDQAPASRHRRPADTTVSYRHLSPKVGLTFDLGRGFNAFASYRHGFRAPSQGQLFQQNSAANTVGLEPVKVNSYETGVRGEVRGRMLYELSVYDMTITDDILTFVTAQNTREAVNAGRSRYRGIEAAVGVALARAVRLDASYAVTSQRYRRYIPQAAQPATATAPAKPAIDYSGNRVEQAPRDLANVLLTFSPSMLKGGRFGVEYNHTGRYAEDAANTHTYGGYDIVALHANVFLRPSTELFVRASNLFDRQYAELVSYDAFQGSQYNPGSPRSVYAGVRYLWGK